jgi:diacylglycerol kinase
MLCSAWWGDKSISIIGLEDSLQNSPLNGQSNRHLGDERESDRGVPSKVLVPLHWRKRIRAASTLAESFYHAFNGVWLGLRTERNLRLHFAAAAGTAFLATILKVDLVGCLALALTVGLVLTAEFINTSLEHLVDLAAGRSYHVSAKAAKDTAAAAVLMASTCAFVIGLMVLGPKLVSLIQSILFHGHLLR